MAFVYPENLTAPTTQLEASRSLPYSSPTLPPIIPSSTVTNDILLCPTTTTTISPSSSFTNVVPHIQMHHSSVKEKVELVSSPTHSYHELYLGNECSKHQRPLSPSLLIDDYNSFSTSTGINFSSILPPTKETASLTTTLAPVPVAELAHLPSFQPYVVNLDNVPMDIPALGNTEPILQTNTSSSSPFTVFPSVTKTSSIISVASSSSSSSSSSPRKLPKRTSSIISSVLPASTKSFVSPHSTNTRLPHSLIIIDTSDSGIQGDADSPAIGGDNNNPRNVEIRKWTTDLVPPTTLLSSNTVIDPVAPPQIKHGTGILTNSSSSITEPSLPPIVVRSSTDKISSSLMVTESSTLSKNVTSTTPLPFPRYSSSSSAPPSTVAEALNAVPVPGGVRIQVNNDKSIILGECIPSHPLQQILPDWAYGKHPYQAIPEQNRYVSRFTCLQPWEEYDENRCGNDPFLQRLQTISKEVPSVHIPTTQWERAIIEASVKDNKAGYDLAWTGSRPWEINRNDTHSHGGTNEPRDPEEKSILDRLSFDTLTTSRQQYQQYLDKIDGSCNLQQLPHGMQSVNIRQVLTGKGRKDTLRNETLWLHVDHIYPFGDETTTEKETNYGIQSNWNNVNRLLRTVSHTAQLSQDNMDIADPNNDSPGEFHDTEESLPSLYGMDGGIDTGKMEKKNGLPTSIGVDKVYRQSNGGNEDCLKKTNSGSTIGKSVNERKPGSIINTAVVSSTITVTNESKSKQPIIVYDESEVQVLQDSNDKETGIHGGYTLNHNNVPLRENRLRGIVSSLTIPEVDHIDDNNGNNETSWVSTVPPPTDLSSGYSFEPSKENAGTNNGVLVPVGKRESIGVLHKSVSIASDRTDVIELTIDTPITDNLKIISKESLGMVKGNSLNASDYRGEKKNAVDSSVDIRQGETMDQTIYRSDNENSVVAVQKSNSRCSLTVSGNEKMVTASMYLPLEGTHGLNVGKYGNSIHEELAGNQINEAEEYKDNGGDDDTDDHDVIISVGESDEENHAVDEAMNEGFMMNNHPESNVNNSSMNGSFSRNTLYEFGSPIYKKSVWFRDFSKEPSGDRNSSSGDKQEESKKGILPWEVKDENNSMDEKDDH